MRFLVSLCLLSSWGQVERAAATGAAPRVATRIAFLPTLRHASCVESRRAGASLALPPSRCHRADTARAAAAARDEDNDDDGADELEAFLAALDALGDAASATDAAAQSLHAAIIEPLEWEVRGLAHI